MKKSLFLRLGVVALLGVVMSGAAQAAQRFDLVRDGRLMVKIVLADKPTPVARYAAEELIKHLELACGVTAAIVGETESGGGVKGCMFIGETAAARRAKIPVDQLTPDEYVVAVVDGALYVVGKEDVAGDPLSEDNNQRGTLFGIYEVLEQSVRVRWLWPGALGTYVPRSQNIFFEGERLQRQPKLRWRTYGWNSVKQAANSYEKRPVALSFSPQGAKNYRHDLAVHLARHRMGFTEKKPATSHAFSYWWKKHGQEHPEWFMLKNGVRGPGDTSNSWNLAHVAMCVSNPDFQRYIVEEVWDGGDDIKLGEVDRRNFCECPNCLAWDGPQVENPPKFVRQDYQPRVVSDRYARFWQTIYAMAVKRNPNVRTTTFLYWNNLPAPLSDIKLHQGIYGEFVPWTGGAVYYPMSAEADAWLREQWIGWERKGITIAYRPNYFHGHYVMPHFSTWQAGEFFRFGYKHGMKGTRFDSLYGHWATKGPMLYMHNRLFWDPELEIKDIRAEYFAGFGPVAAEVERYFDYWENFAINQPGPAYFNPVGVNKRFNETVFQPAEAILVVALDKAKESPLSEYARRVEFLLTGLEHARLAARYIGLTAYGSLKGFGANGVPYRPVEIKDQAMFEECRKALQQLIEFRREHEGEYIADFIDAAKRENRYTDTKSLLKRP